MTRFVAIDRTSYDTWRMRLTTDIADLLPLALLPGPCIAFELEESSESAARPVSADGRISDAAVRRNDVVASDRIGSQATGGKVVSAETRVQGGREVHHIKVLTKDGKVKTHKVNGRRR